MALTESPSPVVCDGSIEQLEEIAAVVAEHFEQYNLIRRDYGLAKSVLSTAMQAAGKDRISIDGYTVQLRNSSPEWWCIDHNRPPAACSYEHDPEQPIAVRPVQVQQYLSIQRKPQQSQKPQANKAAPLPRVA